MILFNKAAWAREIWKTWFCKRPGFFSSISKAMEKKFHGGIFGSVLYVVLVGPVKGQITLAEQKLLFFHNTEHFSGVHIGQLPTRVMLAFEIEALSFPGRKRHRFWERSVHVVCLSGGKE